MNSDDYFASYEEWHEAMIHVCQISLTPDYCEGRVRALQDAKDSSSKRFVELYGSAYRDKVISWFQRAGAGS